MCRRLLPVGITALILVQAGACSSQDGADSSADQAPAPSGDPASPPTASTVFPATTWASATPADVGMDVALLDHARDYALGGGGSGFIARHGKRIYTWGEVSAQYELKSATKSVGSVLLGLATRDRRVSLDDRAQTHLATIGQPPDRNTATGWLDDITLLQLATMTAGFEKTGGFGALVDEPGTMWRYTDGGANWLADVLTQIYSQDLDTLLFDRVLGPIGILRDRMTWRSNAYRPDTLDGIKRREFGSGISSDVESLARIGYLFLRRGEWSGQRILDAEFVDLVRRPVPSVRGLPVHDPAEWQGASDEYGLLWWTNADGHLTDVPREAYWAHGLGDALIIVIPSLDLVVTRLGNEWPRSSARDRDVLSPFIGPIARSAN